MKRGISFILNEKKKKHENTYRSFTQCKRSKREHTKNLSKDLLMECSRHNARLDRVKKLIEAGAELEEKDSRGYTPLLLAVYYNHLEIVKYLINNNANLNAKCNLNTTALYIASKERNIQILSLLIRSHIDLDNPNYNGKSVLIIEFLAANAPEFFLTHFINEVSFYRGLKDPTVHNNYLEILSYGALYAKREDSFNNFKEIVRDPRYFCSLPTSQQKIEICALFDTDSFDELNKLLILLNERSYFVNQSIQQEVQILREINEFIIFGHCFRFKNYFKYQIPKIDIDYHISYEGHRVVQTAPYLAQSLAKFNEFVQNGVQSNRIDITPTFAEKFTLNLATEMLSQFAQNISEKDYLKQAMLFKQSKTYIFTCKWKEHVAGGILFYNEFYFINKGAGSLPGIYCFNIDQDKLPVSPLELAIFFKRLNEHVNSEEHSDSIFDSPEILQLNPVLNTVFKLKEQSGGHCSYVSFKHTIEALFKMVGRNFDSLAKLYGLDIDRSDLILDDFSIDTKKLYRAFKQFNEFYTIDRFIDVNRNSSNIHKWEPLRKFLSKFHGTSNNLGLIKYVSNKLLEEKMRVLEESVPTLSGFEKEVTENLTYSPQLDSSLNVNLDKEWTPCNPQSECISESMDEIQSDYTVSL